MSCNFPRPGLLPVRPVYVRQKTPQARHPMTRQQFKDYAYNSCDDVDRTEEDISNHLSDGWLIKDFKPCVTKGGYIHLFVLYEKETKPQIQ